MSLEAEIDAFVERQSQTGLVFERVSSAPWIDAFEAKLPYRLPPSFRSLVSRYRFAPFTVRGIELFGNRGAGERDGLVIASRRDAVLTRVCQRNGFIQFGRPSMGEYDPVCFDMSRRSKDGEAPIVRLDHEEVLIHERVRAVREYAKSFRELIADAI